MKGVNDMYGRGYGPPPPPPRRGGCGCCLLPFVMGIGLIAVIIVGLVMLL